MKKKKEKEIKVSEKETLEMQIELADNGIIIRNPDDVDNVELATSKEVQNGYGGITVSHDNEIMAIGKRIYDWLIEVVLPEHEEEFIITGFDVKVDAKCSGRDFQI